MSNSHPGNRLFTVQLPFTLAEGFVEVRWARVRAEKKAKKSGNGAQRFVPMRKVQRQST
jgi:hypothetical protein